MAPVHIVSSAGPTGTYDLLTSGVCRMGWKRCVKARGYYYYTSKRECGRNKTHERSRGLFLLSARGTVCFFFVGRVSLDNIWRVLLYLVYGVQNMQSKCVFFIKVVLLLNIYCTCYTTRYKTCNQNARFFLRQVLGPFGRTRQSHAFLTFLPTFPRYFLWY